MQILTVLKTPRIPYSRILGCVQESSILDDPRHALDFSPRVLDIVTNELINV
ncbi:MAG: hypothetical protein KJ718_02380 [Nanoarchaeota archaeon]|nr:hypothetical protein [Nanoarchaeota archaeon]MBU1051378.1 hypothetical protein [Nanoarchaeota archaeon]